MMKPILATFAALSVLTIGGCGADGEPIPPSRDAVTLLAPLPVQVAPLGQ